MLYERQLCGQYSFNSDIVECKELNRVADVEDKEEF